MKKSIVALMLLVVALFTFVYAFAEEYEDEKEPEFIEASVFLNNEEVKLRDNYYIRTGDEVTISVASKNGDPVKGVMAIYTNPEDQFDWYDLLDDEDINAQTYYAVVTMEDREPGTKTRFSVDAWLSGISENGFDDYSNNAYFHEFYNFMWLPSTKPTIGSTFNGAKSYTNISRRDDDNNLSVNALESIKPGSTIKIFDNSVNENADYIFVDCTIDFGGYSFTSEKQEFYFEMPSKVQANMMYELTATTRYKLASDENVEFTTWKTYSLIFAK